MKLIQFTFEVVLNPNEDNPLDPDMAIVSRKAYSEHEARRAILESFYKQNRTVFLIREVERV